MPANNISGTRIRRRYNREFVFFINEFMALAVALTGVSMVVAAGNGELKIQSEASVRKVHAAEIHQTGVEPIPATGQITI